MITNTDRYMCEWYDSIVNSTDMKEEIKTRNFEMLKEYIDIVDDIKIWTMLNRNLSNSNMIVSKHPRMTCVGGVLIYLIYGYCVFLTVANILFLQFVL